jgi:aspartate/methionine/tyrosine aminotransferase
LQKQPKAAIRPVFSNLQPQGISDISEYGAQFDDVIPMWFGESDLMTPEPPRRALIESLESGATFYQAQNGHTALREAIAKYDSRLHAKPIAVDRVTVTASGMTALHVALQMVVDAGDNVVLVTPIWPNAPAAVQIMGAEARRVSLRSQPDGRWRLDLDALFDACDARTRAIFVNSPNNPTGWMCSREEQQAILDFARQKGIWVIADEVYHRIVYDRETAPSFLDLAEPEDPVMAVNSFSKSWAMTGWRLGWLTAPPSVYETLGLLVQYTNSNSPEFIQAAGIAAIKECEPFVEEFRNYCAAGRGIVGDILGRVNRIHIAEPEAAFYAFFKVDGEPDSMALAKRLVREAKVGVAPGMSFGEESEGWLRLCFSQEPNLLRTGLQRMADALR